MILQSSVGIEGGSHRDGFIMIPSGAFRTKNVHTSLMAHSGAVIQVAGNGTPYSVTQQYEKQCLRSFSIFSLRFHEIQHKHVQHMSDQNQY